MSASSVQNAVIRPAPTMGPHPIQRETAIRSFLWDVDAGNNASPATLALWTFKATDAGIYNVLLETGNNTSLAVFRLDDGGTVTLVQDSGAVFAATPTNAKVAIYNNSGVITINNQLGAASTAAAASVTMARIMTA